tara:strand:- start:387 stop:890 length:504 start_codon:yes stop_codon:yes gene_type:complete
MKSKIKQLIKLVEESNINEIEVSSFWGGQKIRVTKSKENANVQPLIMQQPPIQVPQVNIQSEYEKKEIKKTPSEAIRNDLSEEPTVDNIQGDNFTAPLVGTFYAASKPGAKPFVSEGDKILKGQILCIIEAMKIFNEIESEKTGVVKKILVSDGTPVEYGQVLMIID